MKTTLLAATLALQVAAPLAAFASEGAPTMDSAMIPACPGALGTIELVHAAHDMNLMLVNQAQSSEIYAIANASAVNVCEFLLWTWLP